MSDAFSDWDSGDTALLGIALGGIYADISTTKDVLKRGGTETNPIFGTEHPSGAALDQAGIIGGGLTALSADLVGPKYRKELLAGVTGLEGTLAYQNAHLDMTEKKKGFLEILGKPLAVAGLAALLAHSLSSDIKPYLKEAEKSKAEFGLSYERKF